MQLDRVWRDTGLDGPEVEEANTGDRRCAAERSNPLCEGAPQARMNADRADCIRLRNTGVAVSVQYTAGNSTIIVPPVRGSAITKWKSLLSSNLDPTQPRLYAIGRRLDRPVTPLCGSDGGARRRRRARTLPASNRPTVGQSQWPEDVSCRWIRLQQRLEVSRVDVLGVSFGVGHLVDRRNGLAPSFDIFVAAIVVRSGARSNLDLRSFGHLARVAQ